jgi:Xaa-Pro aminopeptidase
MYLHQIERLTSALDAAGVEALVASSVANVAYVTGFRSLTHALLHTPQFAVFTRRGTAPVCGGPASFICEPQIEALWAKHQASIDPAERERLVKEIQRIVVEQLPEGEAVHRYWNTLHELPDSLGDRLPRRACREVRQFLDCFAHRDLRVCRSRLTLILWRDERQLLDPEDEDDEGE